MEHPTPADAIPMFRELLLRQELSRTAILLYGVLATLDSGDGAVVSIRELSALSGISPDSRKWSGVRKQMRSLEAAGLVRRSDYTGGALRYHVLGPVVPRASSLLVDTPATIEAMPE